MINLLPDSSKLEIRAARLNVILARYIIIVLFAFGFLVLLLSGSYLVLTQNKESAERLIEANNSKTDVYTTTKAQLRALNATFAQTKPILDQEILYSNVLINIGKLMPAGTVLGTISLNTASFGGTPLSMKAYAKTTEDAINLRQKFQSTPFFSNVNFDSVSDSKGVPGYPVEVSMTLVITKAAAQ